jgi:ribose transport system substrate-binding protein
MTQLLSQDVDAVLLDAVNPAVVTAGLQKAKAKNIPVVLYGGSGSPSELISAAIVPNDVTLAAIATDYLVNVLGGKGEIAIMTTDGIPFAGNRTAQLRFELKQFPGIKVAAVHQVDFAKFDSDLMSATKSVLQAHPDIKAIFATISPFPTPIAAALRQLGKTDDVKVFGFYAYPSELQLIRKGQLAGVADASFPHNAYQAVDALAQFFGKQTPISSADAYRLPLGYDLVTKDNAPPEGQGVKTRVDFVGYYGRLWANEFTVAHR